MRVEIRAEPFSPWREVGEHEARCLGAAGAHGKYGACAAFVGSMRDFNDSNDFNDSSRGESVRAMTLEHYAGMTERQLTQLAEDAVARHRLSDALILHRIGDLRPGDPIVLVAAWSAHRAEAFAACREMMEELKTRATFWKKESTAAGERWVERNTPFREV